MILPGSQTSKQNWKMWYWKKQRSRRIFGVEPDFLLEWDKQIIWPIKFGCKMTSTYWDTFQKYVVKSPWTWSWVSIWCITSVLGPPAICLWSNEKLHFYHLYPFPGLRIPKKWPTNHHFTCLCSLAIQEEWKNLTHCCTNSYLQFWYMFSIISHWSEKLSFYGKYIFYMKSTKWIFKFDNNSDWNSS